MPQLNSNVIGLDIGGANLKAATPDGRALTVPFALWKQPERLPAALTDLVSRFPDASDFAVTMTGELCDCYETKREGVNAILDAVETAAGGRPVRTWSTRGEFLPLVAARANHIAVAASNWHALATFAGRFAPRGHALLIDTGSTTTDLIPLFEGAPCPRGRTDWERLAARELLYRGVGRTAVHAVLTERVCAELFATTQDVFVVLDSIPENAANCDTADGRPLTREKSLARLARMLGGDRETLDESAILDFARRVHNRLLDEFREAFQAAIRNAKVQTIIVSGAGEFLIRAALAATPETANVSRIVSLNEELGPGVSACAPAYALAVLATERTA